MEDTADLSSLRYVLYARKSTDDPQRQVRSINDQIYECLQLADRYDLNIVNRNRPLIEKKSAKKPDQRPIFRKMLEDIRKGVFDGILAWNPDRLARNMKEGGEIIDMVDAGQIIDLKFVTHTFSNDANGKMLLGMAFVLSKQYSDDLSQKVTRGNRRNFAEGKMPTPKHGYLRDNEGLYRPNEATFVLIQNAWQLRIKGASLKHIVNITNKAGYERITKEGRRIKLTEQIITKLFKDPFYYGILVLKKTGQSVDLRQLYNFVPMISEQEYNTVQSLQFRRIKPTKPHKQAFYPLKTMVLCYFCGSPMYIGPSTGHYVYLYARCDNLLCNRKKKSIRMKIIFDFIYEFLADRFNFTEEAYKNYLNRMAKLSDRKREGLTIELHSKQGQLKHVEFEIKERSLNIVKLERSSVAWKINDEKINELASERAGLEDAVNKLKEKLTTPESDRLNLKEFLNISKNAATIVKSANSVIKDQICRLIFLNFTVSEANVLSYQLKEPFATLLKQRLTSSSRGERT